MTSIYSQPMAATAKRHVYHPVIDFLLLGGGSIVFLLVMIYGVPDNSQTTAKALALSALLAHVINHPHFAYSYQMFYAGFFYKIRGQDYAKILRLRYVFAGVVVPLLIVGFFVYALGQDNHKTLGYSVNAMMLFVGWHYVKQGYGILMVKAAFKKQYFTPKEKHLLLVNAYATWIAFWLYGNAGSISHAYDFWGIPYYSFQLPVGLKTSFQGLAMVTTVFTFGMLCWRAHQKGRAALPINGLVAYAASIYIWLFPLLQPATLYFMPAFHSLQYMAIVWRYKTTESQHKPSLNCWLFRVLEISSAQARFMGFCLMGVLLGYLGFWGVPKYLNANIDYDKAIFGSALYLFMAWIFINIHHYFMDNVMWRRDNPNVKKYLFN